MTNRTQRSTSFGAVAAEYDRLRPPPADEAVDWLVPGQARTVVDLGAGTGLLSRALARRAAHVVAIEPDERMRAVLARRSPGVDAIDGRGERIPLGDAAADGVFASSAWHWMDPARAVPEIARVLRDGGRFGLIWTTREPDIPWIQAPDWFREAYEQAGPDENPMPRDAEGRRRIVLPDGSPFTNIETSTFYYSRRMTPAAVVDMLTTYSAVITADPEYVAIGRDRALAAVRAAFPGAEEIDLPVRSYCWRADRLPR
jgi:SAM-dependent methyltransferase